MNSFVTVVGYVFLAIVLAIGLGMVFAVPIMWLWNVLMPDIFGLPKISFLQAWGINILCGLLLKDFSSKKQGEHK